MLWGKISGQEEAVAYLRQAIKRDKVVNAYLFQGPEGVGKSLAASVFARALNCPEDFGDGCGRCPICRAIEKGSHPDFHRVYPASKSRSITIDQIRELQSKAYLKSGGSGWKVLIVHNAETMVLAAQNALLKTLEEPPDRTAIILISSRPEQLLPTILSRCQAVRFRTWPLDLMVDLLRSKAGLEEEEARVMHGISRGRPGWALQAIEQGLLEDRKRILKPFAEFRFLTAGETVEQSRLWHEILDGKSKDMRRELEKQWKSLEGDLDSASRKRIKEKDEASLIAAERENLQMLFGFIYSWFRDLYVHRQAGSPDGLINQDFRNEIAENSGRFSEPELRRTITWIERCRGNAVRASGRSIRQLIFENLFIGLGCWRAPEH